MSQAVELKQEPPVEIKRPVNAYIVYGMNLGIVSVFLVLIAFAVQVKFKFSLPWNLVTLDALVIFSLFAFFGFPMIFRFCSQMESAHRMVLMFSLAPFICGHFLVLSRDYFPVMSWFIFTRGPETDFVTCREMIGIQADGKEHRLLVEQIFPSIVQFDLPTDVDGKRDPNMSQIVTAVAEEYNRLNPMSPVVRVDLREFSVPVRPKSPQDKPTWIPIESYSISSAPSKS